MGVAGLWEVLKPAAKTRSLTSLAIKEGFESNPDGKRGFRLGIDVSIWFFHAEHVREGENPGLRTIFFRCATLMETTFLPIFVFDGPKRPNVKRGKTVNKSAHKLIPGVKRIVEAFGFEWRMAPGEAEAELAYLNRTGVIDGILSDDVDAFLFGATTVIRNSSNMLAGNRAFPALNSAGKDDKNHTHVFQLQDITAHPNIKLSRGGMILIGLMKGGDYHEGGILGCGIATAHSLAKCGFGDSLFEAACTLSREALSEFLAHWRDGIRRELRTDSRKIIGQKLVSLSKEIPDNFPDIDILLSYIHPVSSESMGKESNIPLPTWTKEPNIPELAATCELYFEWGTKDVIIKRFRGVLWHSIVLRILRRAVLDHDAASEPTLGHQLLPLTPQKRRANTNRGKFCGTPTKMIAKHFSTLGVSENQSGSEDNEWNNRLITRIHFKRMHVSTDGLLEYRLEIAPKQLVKLAESGIKGIRADRGTVGDWKFDLEEEDVIDDGKRGAIDPETHLRVWMPACMVRIAEPALVQEFEDKEKQKRLRDSKKHIRATAAVKDGPSKEVREKKAQRLNQPFQPPSNIKDNIFSMFAFPAAQGPIPMSSNNCHGSFALSDTTPVPSYLTPTIHSPISAMSPMPSLSESLMHRPAQASDIFLSSPSVSSRTGIKDLTKKNRSYVDRIAAASLEQESLLRSTPDRALSDAIRSEKIGRLSADKLIPAEFPIAPLAPASSAVKKEGSQFYDSLFGLQMQKFSKRRANTNGAYDSDSEPNTTERQRVHKSPRKHPLHTSPQCPLPASPTPAARLPGKILIADVIEISDDSESDMPTLLPQATNVQNLQRPQTAGPCLSRSTAGSAFTLTSTSVSKKYAPKKVKPIISDDIIDLTV